jgi:hypothetical protein
LNHAFQVQILSLFARSGGVIGVRGGGVEGGGVGRVWDGIEVQVLFSRRNHCAA